MPKCKESEKERDEINSFTRKYLAIVNIVAKTKTKQSERNIQSFFFSFACLVTLCEFGHVRPYMLRGNVQAIKIYRVDFTEL